MSVRNWFIKCGIAIATPLLVYSAIAAAGPKAPPLPTGRDGALEVLNRYTQGPVPGIVLVGSSFTARLKEEYFDAPNLKVLGLAGGSSITALEVLMGRERLPKIVLIEMNILERGEDLALVQRFTDGANASTLPRPIKSAVAFYERWLHAPPDRRQADAMVAALLQAQPSDFDNRVYVDRTMREWNASLPTAEITKNAAVLEHLVRQIEAELGVTEVFWKVAVKPGKPISFGVLGVRLVFGLPGNPVSALVGFELFVRPALLALQGVADPLPRFERGRLAQGLEPNAHRDELVRARLLPDTEGPVLDPLPGRESHLIVRAAAADALVLVPMGEGALSAGDSVEFLRL